jgi:hypothetical protein
MASFRRLAFIGDCWQVHRYDHRILIEQPGVTSRPPINVLGQPAIRRRHSAMASTAFAITAMSPSAPGTSTSGRRCWQCSQVHLRHRRCEHGGYACGTHGSRMTSTVYARLRCCATLSPIALLTLLELPHQHQSSHRNVAKPRLVSQLLDTTMLITFD